MKIILTLAIALFSTGLFAQISNDVTATATRSRDLINMASSTKYGSTMTIYNPKRRVDGSVYLFENWTNYALIITNDKQKFSLKNINLNIERNTFESKYSGDSIFTFNFNNIDRFVVNNKVYKNFYYNDDNRVYELIYESDEFIIMKGYRILFVEGSSNPMLNRRNDAYKKKYSYYIKKDNKIKLFKLKKKRILKLVDGDLDRMKKIEQFVKSNRLSYKKENDVRRVLSFTAKN